MLTTRGHFIVSTLNDLDDVFQHDWMRKIEQRTQDVRLSKLLKHAAPRCCIAVVAQLLLLHYAPDANF
jgi:hypothetical protein